jgi:acetolactate synthase-1/2/3 large subunit
MDSDEKPIKPQRVMKELQNALRHDAIITAAAGFCKDWASTLLEIHEPRTWIHPAGITPMGYALCGAIGAKIAKPERQVVAVTGDGAFQMVCQELITAVENDAPVLICLLNDERYGMIHYIQEKRHGGRYFATEFQRKPDFVKLAEAFGAEGRRIDDPAELGTAFKTGLSSGKPYLLDIVIDKNEVPGVI